MGVDEDGGLQVIDIGSRVEVIMENFPIIAIPTLHIISRQIFSFFFFSLFSRPRAGLATV